MSASESTTLDPAHQRPASPALAAAARARTLVRGGIAVFAAYHYAIAALMVFAPRLFFEDVGPFGIRNDHYLRDTASFELAFALALTIAYRRSSWRVPVLCCVTAQFALHALNHLVDIGAAHPYWLGPADFVSLTLAAGALAWLAREAIRHPEVEP